VIDVIAATAVLVGAFLALLGSVGLVRFPDVFTRMHAATKSASLAVILTTLAAALEVDTFGAVALLTLVSAFLFLSAPLGASLLARAAYHDPNTSRLLPGQDDLERFGDGDESSSLGDRPGAAGLLIGWLIVVWIALSAGGSPAVVVGAIGVAVLVALALPAYRPRWPEGVFKPVAALRFAGTFVWAIVQANFEVAAAVIRPRRLHPAVVGLPLRITSRTELALLMNVITFTPGTVALEVQDTRLFIHVMDLRDEELFRRRFEALESRIIDAFGTRLERLPR
jgi:multicomponent Na+:H+ antiporter subunit G